MITHVTSRYENNTEVSHHGSTVEYINSLNKYSVQTVHQMIMHYSFTYTYFSRRDLALENI